MSKIFELTIKEKIYREYDDWLQHYENNVFGDGLPGYIGTPINALGLDEILASTNYRDATGYAEADDYAVGRVDRYLRNIRPLLK